LRKEGDKYIYVENKGREKKETLKDINTPIAKMLKDSKKDKEDAKQKNMDYDDWGHHSSLLNKHYKAAVRKIDRSL
jgi:hypothetical protein